MGTDKKITDLTLTSSVNDSDFLIVQQGDVTRRATVTQVQLADVSLDGLADVSVTGVSSGQFLKWDGSAWVADTLSGGGDLLSTNNLSELTNTSAALNNLGIDQIDSSVDANTSAIDVLETSVSSINTLISAINTSISTVYSSVSANEQAISSVDSRATSIMGDVSALQTSVGNLETARTSLRSAITSVDNRFDNVLASVSAINTDLSNVSLALTSLNSRTATNESDISNLQTDVASVKSNVPYTLVCLTDTSLDTGAGTDGYFVSWDNSESQFILKEVSVTGGSSDVSQSSVDANASAIAVLESSVSSNNTAITSLEQDVSVLFDARTSLGGVDTSINSRITSVDDRFTSVNSDISSVDSRITSVQGNVSNNDTEISNLQTSVQSFRTSLGAVDTSLDNRITSVANNQSLSLVSLTDTSLETGVATSGYVVGWDNTKDQFTLFEKTVTSGGGTGASVAFRFVSAGTSAVEATSVSDVLNIKSEGQATVDVSGGSLIIGTSGVPSQTSLDANSSAIADLQAEAITSNGGDQTIGGSLVLSKVGNTKLELRDSGGSGFPNFVWIRASGGSQTPAHWDWLLNSDGSLRLRSDVSDTPEVIMDWYSGGGVVLATAAGGDQGVGTINTRGIFVSGVDQEARITSVDSRITSLQADVSSNDTDISNLQTSVQSFRTSLSNSITSVDDRVTSVNSRVNTVSAGLTSVNNKITSVQNRFVYDSYSGFIESTSVKEYVIDPILYKGYRVRAVFANTSSGTCTYSLQENGSNISGFTSILASSGTSVFTCASPVSVEAGNKLSLNITANTSAKDLAFTVGLERSVS